jgi:hypothetical protein
LQDAPKFAQTGIFCFENMPSTLSIYKRFSAKYLKIAIITLAPRWNVDQLRRFTSTEMVSFLISVKFADEAELRVSDLGPILQKLHFGRKLFDKFSSLNLGEISAQNNIS